MYLIREFIVCNMGRPIVPELEFISIPHEGTGKMVKIDLWKQTAIIEDCPVVFVNPSIEKDNTLEPISKEDWMKLMCEGVPYVVKDMANSATYVVIGWEAYCPIEIHFSEPKNGYTFIYMSPI